MNASVTVTGMQVKTQVSNNLFITGDTLSSTAKKDDSFFGTSLSQTVKGYLEPVSTVNGTSFYYTLNAKADGSKQSGDYIEYNAATAATGPSAASYGNKFSQDYGVLSSTVSAFNNEKTSADAYVDYVFQLKAVATSASFINLSKVYLIDGNSKDASKAYRVAVFTEDITGGTATAGVGTKQIILTETGAANQESGKAVNSTTTTAAVSYNAYADDTNNTLITIDDAGTTYYKVVVRMWLEGEDTTCYNGMFLGLDQTWSLDLDIDLSTSATPAATVLSKLWYANVSSTDYWYDGTNVYTNLADAKKATNGTAKASAAEPVKTAFGIPTV